MLEEGLLEKEENSFALLEQMVNVSKLINKGGTPTIEAEDVILYIKTLDDFTNSNAFGRLVRKRPTILSELQSALKVVRGYCESKHGSLFDYMIKSYQTK